MLQQRIMTAIVLASLVAVAIFKLPIELIALMFGIIILIAAWEWGNMIGITEKREKYFFLLGLLGPMLFIQFWTQFLEGLQYLIESAQQGLYQHAKQAGWTSVSTFLEGFDIKDVRYYSGMLEWLVIPPILFWVVVMFVIKHTPSGALNLQLSIGKKKLIGGFVLVLAWMFFVRLRALYPPEITMYLLVLIWMADIAAYFIGKAYGKTKLAPDISPGKTMAGFYGALGSSVVCGVIFCLIFGLPVMNATDFVMISMLTVLISVFGDLFFSVVKRQSGMKDSGNILPGHGGILDRIDSMIAATPVFYAGIYLLYRLIEDAQNAGVVE